jgi:cobalt-zinc-cadmium resistance protein CzcA
MVRAIIQWAVNNPLVVLLLVAAWITVGLYSSPLPVVGNLNVEAYPDPAPAIVEVVAQYPGASAEEVERQVSVPLEVAFAGMPGLTMTRSKSLFGLAHLRNQFEYGRDFWACRQEVINRLSILSQPLPQGVVPQISPQNPIGEIYRYTLKSPKDRYGNDIYTLNDLKTLQDWVLEREFRRVPHIMDVTSTGGTVKRYEIHPDPDRLKRYGVTLSQLQTALTNSNQNVGADLMTQGHIVLNVRSVGLYGGGLDPVEQVLGLGDPYLAAHKLREEENRRVYEIRQIVIASVNNRPVKIDHIVEGGPLSPGDPVGERGVVVGHQTRLGRVSLSKPAENAEDRTWRIEDRASRGDNSSFFDSPDSSVSSTKRAWRDEDDKVQCIVLLRSGDQTIPAVEAVKAKVAELNDPEHGRMLPGVQIEPYYDRNDLVHVTTETVEENLILGMVLVTAVLLMFLSNIRTALIVAINIPIALLFAFTMLYFRGRSANLLSIGAVDFGIIVDSSVIMVENIYRHLSAGEYADLPLKERILKACREVERPLFYSTAIMVCAFIPLFTMHGPEGQLFGPMADTYAFALAGALVLAVMLAPVLCLLLFRNFQPIHDNFFVRFLKSRYLWQLRMCLKYRGVTLLVMGSLVAITLLMLPSLGQEFMPQLEEGNLWITAMFPLNSSMERVAQDIDKARMIIASYPEVEVLVPAIGRPDDGTDPTGYYRVEIFAPLKPMKEWPRVKEIHGWRRYLFGASRQQTKEELTLAMNQELRDTLPGVDWNFSQYIRDNVTEALAGVKGDNAVKIFGPDLDKLEELAAEVKNRLEQVPGIQEVGIFNIKGQSNLEFRVDLDKCAKWGVSAADVNNLVQAAVGGKAQTSMIEGEKLFDVSLRWPKAYRSSETSILDMQVDITNNQVVPVTGPSYTPSPTGSGIVPPSTVGSLVQTGNPITNTPRLRLLDLVSPVGRNGAPDPNGTFERAGASTIYREQGKRMIAVKFNVRERDLGSAVAEAKEKTQDLLQSPYRAVWAGEFNEMEKAQQRLLLIIPLSLGLVFILLYLAFHSLLDAVVVFSNVVALSLGGIWALLLTGTSFSISAAVGFVSLFGVAIMDGLLLISSFNAFRAQGEPLEEAILHGASNRVRAVMMTALTAILGLLPAALALRPAWNSSGELRWVEGIGSQTQRPLAIVVVGGMITTLFLTRYLMPVLYSFYGHRQPPAEASGLAH